MCWMKERSWVLIPTSIFSCASFACLCVAVVTDHWLYASERLNNTNLFRNTTAGLWRKCIRDVSIVPNDWCERIDYFKHIDRDGLAPTESILLSLRKFAWFPLFSLFILLIGECCCVASQCNSQKNTLTLVAGIMFVIGGLFVLIGIVVFIGAVTEEASNSNKSRPSSDDHMRIFHYRYGPSFILTVFSFISSESTGVLSVYLYISLYQLAYRKDRDHFEIPVDVNSEALTQLQAEQSSELDYRTINTHNKHQLLTYPEDDDDFSVKGISPLIDSIGSDAALLSNQGYQSKLGNACLSSTSIQKGYIQSFKQQNWKFKNNKTLTTLVNTELTGSPNHQERFAQIQHFYQRRQQKSSFKQRSFVNSTLLDRCAVIVKHSKTDSHQQVPKNHHLLSQSSQRRFQLLRQDSLKKSKPTAAKQTRHKSHQRQQNRRDWLMNSPSPTTLYKDSATQYSPLLSQIIKHNSFKTFETSSFSLRSPGSGHEKSGKITDRNDFDFNKLGKWRGYSNRRPCCCQPRLIQHQNQNLPQWVSSSSKQLDSACYKQVGGHRQLSENPLEAINLMARSAHYLPRCGLVDEDDWGTSASSEYRARSMHELRYFNYCNPQHLKSLVRPLLNDESNLYFTRTTPV